MSKMAPIFLTYFWRSRWCEVRKAYCPNIYTVPKGKMRKSDNMGENTICASNERSWQIPINGHLYNSTELWNNKKLVYDNRSLVSLYRYDFKFMTHEIIHSEIFWELKSILASKKCVLGFPFHRSLGNFRSCNL